MLDNILGLDDYLSKYGHLLGAQAERALAPLHVPGRDEPALPELLRAPYPAQAHVIEAMAKALRRQKAVILAAEMGGGKSFMAAVAVHQHAGGRPYRGLVMCPGQLTLKWKRELEETLPGVTVTVLDDWHAVAAIDRSAAKDGAHWFVIARDRAKLGSKWRAAILDRGRLANRRDKGFLRCPKCGERLADKDGLALKREDCERKRLSCEWVVSEEGRAQGCGSPLWQLTGELKRFEPASYIKRKLRGFFDYLVLDEVHELKATDSAQANAGGTLAAACKKVIALTGTLIGGYAEHLRSLLFRLAPASVVGEEFGWDTMMPFNECYGRIETTEITRGKDGFEGGEDNRQSRGSTRTQRSKKVIPGVMPALFGRHLIDKVIFLGLDEVADELPPFEEECLPIPMDPELASEYAHVEDKLRDALKDMLIRGDKRLLGAMLQTLLAYPDHPFGWDTVGYFDKGDEGAFHAVVTPRNLDADQIRPKEQALIEFCKKEKAEGRQVWVYVQFTGERDVQGRIEKLLKKAKLKVGSLRSSVSLTRREEWIAKHGPKCDVVISHPKLVETGLDLFDKGGAHNFATLVFYGTGYNLFTLRQAARRAWRIGQKLPCKVVYLYYQGTMQDRAMALMGRKLTAARTVEGKFSAEGLVALAGEDGGSVEAALARSLAERSDVGDARRAWMKAQPAKKKAARQRPGAWVPARAAAKSSRPKGGKKRRGPR